MLKKVWVFPVVFENAICCVGKNAGFSAVRNVFRAISVTRMATPET
jgi:hypothetical protein